MPSEGPGRRYDAIATKAAVHGAPVVELNHAGQAAKSAQAVPMAVSVANATIAQQIAVGEEFVIMLDGVHEFANSYLPASGAVGDQLWINPANNALARASSAGFVKFGVIDWIDTTLGRFQVNLTQRSSY